MIKLLNNSDRRIVGGATLSDNKEVSAGRQNLLSALWGIRPTRSVGTMPNGDPPSVMLWGVEEEAPDKRSGRW